MPSRHGLSPSQPFSIRFRLPPSKILPAPSRSRWSQSVVGAINNEARSLAQHAKADKIVLACFDHASI